MDLETHRNKFEERMRLAQEEMTNKILSSQKQLDTEQKKFDAALLEYGERTHVLKAEKEQQKLDFDEKLGQQRLEFENKIKAKNLEIQEDLAELEALKNEVDARVEKERVSLQKQFKIDTDGLQDQVKILKNEKVQLQKQYDDQIVTLDNTLQARTQQFSKDHKDLDDQWTLRYNTVMKDAQEDKTRMISEHEKKIASLQAITGWNMKAIICQKSMLNVYHTHFPSLRMTMMTTMMKTTVTITTLRKKDIMK